MNAGENIAVVKMSSIFFVFLPLLICSANAYVPFACVEVGCSWCSAPRVRLGCDVECAACEANNQVKQYQIYEDGSSASSGGNSVSGGANSVSGDGGAGSGGAGGGGSGGVGSTSSGGGGGGGPISDEQADSRFRTCCHDYIPYTECQGLCRYDLTVTDFSMGVTPSAEPENGKCPLSMLNTFIYCASDGHDNQDCCMKKGILATSPCINLCKSNPKIAVIGNEYIQCVNSFSDIVKCHRSGLTA